MSNRLDGRSQPPQEADDARLVREARRGDLAAFDELIGRYQRRAVAVAYRLLNHMDDALEVTQDAFLKSYEKLDSLQRPSRFGGWLMRIVTNLALNKRRSRSLRRATSLDQQNEDGDPLRLEGDADRPEEIASASDLDGRIHDELARLPETQRQALVLFSMEKLPQKEVAEILGLSVQAVKWHVFTARKKLRERLADYL